VIVALALSALDFGWVAVSCCVVHALQSHAEGGTHGKSKGANIPGIRSESRENEFSETAPELRQGARSSRPFEKFSQETHSFRCRAEEDQFGSESTLGKKNLERLSNDGGTQAQIVSGCQKEDRSGPAGKVGEGPRWR
jgi:hypothetical protein